MTKTFCGIDEAGRGPVIGPLVLACAVFDEASLDELYELKIRDSKKMSVKKRQETEPEIKEIAKEYKLKKISPTDIDRLRKKQSLNVIEAVESARLICSLKDFPTRIVVDAADSISQNYKKKILDALDEIGSCELKSELICEHRADDNYIEASAASVLAKVERDRVIEKLKLEWGDFGSGYPSDPLTQKFIQKLLRQASLPDIVRKSWNTVERRKQSSLAEY